MKDRTLEHLGKILPNDEEFDRDAIHVAVLPVVAGEAWMAPGQGIRLLGDGSNVVVRSELVYGHAHGIVDPFLRNCPDEGERFFMFLLPGSTSGLTHHWSSPIIDPALKVPESPHEAWLRRFCAKWNFNYDQMILIAMDPKDPEDEDWDVIVAGGKDLHDPSDLGEDHDEFWRRLSALTGRGFSDDHRKKVTWSCSC